ncbi:MAG: hypothetical protein EA401_10215 [Planctomycetota bacterium]|nr:MAG: hypothetical protein EA401_10215 [Planctomycetota bacterium]
MINRSAVTIRYKEPFVRWIMEADPLPERRLNLSVEDVNKDRTVFLISENEGEMIVNDADFAAWAKRNYRNIFESELEAWYRDPQLWPKQRSYAVFQRWFDLEFHGSVVDLDDQPITEY